MAEPKEFISKIKWRIYGHILPFSNCIPMIFGAHLQEALVLISVVKILPYSTF